MKKNLPNDGLEKYLKESFEGFEENPSNDIWDKINAGLNGGTKSVSSPKPIYKTWWVAASLALVVGAIAAQHFYFENKIENITQQIENQQNTNKNHIESENKTQQENLELVKENISSEGAQKSSNKIEEVVKDSKSNQKNPLKNKPISIEKNDTQKIQSIVKQENSSTKRIRNFEDEFTPQNQAVDEERSSIYDTAESKEYLSNFEQKNEINSSELAKKTKQNINEIFLLDLKKQELKIPIYQPELNIPFAASIKPIQSTKSKLSIGAYAGVFLLNEQINFEKFRDDFFRNIIERRKRTLNKTNYGSSYQSGLKIGLNLYKNWTLTSGLGYRSNQFDFDFETELKYKDSFVGPNRDNKFKLYLKTPLGIDELEFRAMKTTNDRIPDDEKLPINFSGSRTTNFVVIPLEIGYQQQIGAWGFGGFLGAQLKLVQSDKVNIGSVIIDNDKFERKPSFDLDSRSKQTRPNSIDLIAGLSVNYLLNDNWQIEISPMFQHQTTGITLRHSTSRTQSFGGEIGINYLF